MGMVASDEGGVKHSRQADVVDEAAPAAQKRRILDTLNSGAEDLVAVRGGGRRRVGWFHPLPRYGNPATNITATFAP